MDNSKPLTKMCNLVGSRSFPEFPKTCMKMNKNVIRLIEAPACIHKYFLYELVFLYHASSPSNHHTHAACRFRRMQMRTEYSMWHRLRIRDARCTEPALGLALSCDLWMELPKRRKVGMPVVVLGVHAAVAMVQQFACDWNYESYTNIPLPS
jgi:hypothetical protein